MASAGMQLRVQRLALASIAVAFLVMAIKFAAWWVTGSVALYSDALESIVNVIAAGVAWWAIGVSLKPADDEHPFGHHKAEYFSAVAEGVLIVLAAILILHSAGQAIWSGVLVLTEPGLGMAINLIAAAINAAWAYVLIRNGRAARSPALIADAHHIRADVITSIGVIVGLLLALVTGWLILDPLLAIVVACNVLWQGYKIILASMHGLMDHALEPEEREQISALITENSGEAIEFHDLKTRVAGAARFVEFHLVVASDMTVARSHRLCDRIEEALRRRFDNVRTTIHVEPEHKAKHSEDGT
jgi:cation diffusion facilitator family transporter